MSDSTYSTDAVFDAELEAEFAREAEQVEARTKREEANKTDNQRWLDYYSDAKLAERFLATNPHVYWVTEYQEWFGYVEDTGTWRRFDTREVYTLLQAFLKTEWDDAQATTSAARKNAASRVCLSSTTLRRLTDWMGGQRTISRTRFDQHKDLIVVANGVVDLRTGTLSNHDPSLFMTQRIAYAYDRDARSVLLNKALTALPEDSLDQFQVIAGQALTGHQPSKPRLFCFFAEGNNGKSTIIDLLMASAGDYAAIPPKKMLLKGNESNFHSIKLKNVRQAVFEELPDEKHLDGGVIRDIAGTRFMTGEHKGKDAEQFEVNATIFLTFNSRPLVSEAVHGVWRRLALFTFPFKFVEKSEDECLPHERALDARLDKLAERNEEAVRAFLAWRIEGARRWYEQDMIESHDCASVEQGTQAWRFANDQVGHWLMENCRFDPNYFVLVDDAVDNFNQFRNTPRAQVGKTTFIEKLSSHALFAEHGLEYRQTSRHSKLKQSEWKRDKDNAFETPRKAKTQATFIQGLRFVDQTNWHADTDDTIDDEFEKVVSIIDF